MKIIASDLQTYFHVFSALAAINTVDTDGGKEAVFFIKPNSLGEYCVPEGNLVAFGVNVKITHQRPKSRDVGEWLRLFFLFLIFCFNRLLYKGDRRRVFVHHTYFKPDALLFLDGVIFYRPLVLSIEEGVGTYGGYHHHLKTKLTEGKKLAGIKYLIRKLLSIFVDKKFGVLNTPTLTEKRLFAEAVKILNQYMRWNDDGLIVTEKNKKRVLLVTSNLLDSGVVSREKYKKILIGIKLIYSDCSFCVKPHPIEKQSLNIYTELGMDVVSASLPGEYVVSRVKPDIIIGFVSGLLLSAYYIYDVEYYYITRKFLGIKESDEVDQSVMRLFDSRREFKGICT